jgi:hypothetical protein
MNKSTAHKIPFVILLILIGLTLVAPFLVSAQTLPDTHTTPLPKIWDPLDLGDQLLVCTGTVSSYQLYNCEDICDLVYQVIWIVYLAITWVIWAIAPLSFVAGGIMYMFAGANPSMETTAKAILKGAVIGVAIVLSSYLIINTVVTFFHISGIGGFGTSACTIQ